AGGGVRRTPGGQRRGGEGGGTGQGGQAAGGLHRDPRFTGRGAPRTLPAANACGHCCVLGWGAKGTTNSWPLSPPGLFGDAWWYRPLSTGPGAVPSACGASPPITPTKVSEPPLAMSLRPVAATAAASVHDWPDTRGESSIVRELRSRASTEGCT